MLHLHIRQFLMYIIHMQWFMQLLANNNGNTSSSLSTQLEVIYCILYHVYAQHNTTVCNYVITPLSICLPLVVMNFI